MTPAVHCSILIKIQMAADIEERMNAEQAATEEAVARRREEMDAAAAERDAMTAKSEAIKRLAEKRVGSWASGKSLAVLLGDLHTIYPHAPPLAIPDEADIKKTYMKAARTIHPDKVITNEHNKLFCFSTLNTL